MKMHRSFLLAVVMLFSTLGVVAQDLSTPVGYMNAFSKAHSEMSKAYLSYMSAASHGRRAKKVEKLRLKLLETIIDTRNNTNGLGAYRGDNSLRQSSVQYIMLVYHIFNDDYARIVNMEEVAERSFDEMQAYLVLQELTEEKLREASEKWQEAERQFAAKHEIKLVSEKSELGEKLEAASNLNRYKNKIYLIFFKCNWQDGVITDALNNKKLSDIEQARNALINYANEGLAALDTIKKYNGDPSLELACRQVLNFYKKMAENELPKMIDFYLKQENFEKIKKSFESKPESKRTKEDVDAYNKAVNEVNAAVNVFNRNNEQVNKTRRQLLENWSKVEKEFTDRHMPYYK